MEGKTELQTPTKDMFSHAYLGDLKTYLEEESKNPPMTPLVKPYYAHCRTCNEKNQEFEQINDGAFDRKFSEELWRIKLKNVEKNFYKSFGNLSLIHI